MDWQVQNLDDITVCTFRFWHAGYEASNIIMNTARVTPLVYHKQAIYEYSLEFYPLQRLLPAKIPPLVYKKSNNKIHWVHAQPFYVPGLQGRSRAAVNQQSYNSVD